MTWFRPTELILTKLLEPAEWLSYSFCFCFRLFAFCISHSSFFLVLLPATWQKYGIQKTWTKALYLFRELDQTQVSRSGCSPSHYLSSRLPWRPLLAPWWSASPRHGSASLLFFDHYACPMDIVHPSFHISFFWSSHYFRSSPAIASLQKDGSRWRRKK